MGTETTHGAGVPRTDRTGSRRVGGTRSGGTRKLLPLLLGLVLAIALALLLISLIGGDDSGDGNTGSNGGQLTANGVSLLPPPTKGLSAQAGKTATGKDVVVQSVNGNEGFFVGSSAKERVYVEWGGDVGENEASRFRPQKDQRVNLTGPLQPAGTTQLSRLKLSAADAELVRSQGAFVNADRVALAK